MVAEVVSSNWQDDYARKVEEYALLNIPEYWIVDFCGLGGLQFIGNPKQPTFVVCQLVNGVYQQQYYRLGDWIHSALFPNLYQIPKCLLQLSEPPVAIATGGSLE